MKRIFCVGLDTFSRKNISQVEAAYSGGYYFDVFCSDSRGISREVFAPFERQGSKIYCVKKRLFFRLFTFVKCLLTNKYAHAELYPAGRMGFLYAIIMKLLRLKFLVIERGDIGCIDDYDRLTQFSIFLSYKLANGVIYKEVYMKEPLLKHGAKRLFFLPNCVSKAPNKANVKGLDKTGFLWVNRVIRQRRAHWLTAAFAQQDALNNETLDVVGFNYGLNSNETKIASEIEALNYSGENIHCHELQEPFDFYNTRRFFCLPSQVVFGNNSLLEAMSYGLIPIVTNASGVDLLIEDGENGIVTEMTKESYAQGLKRAAELTDEQVNKMSVAARQTVAIKHSNENWTKQLLEIYDHL